MRTQVEARWLTAGAKNKQFEIELSKKWGVRNAVTCNSGSSANLLAVAALVESGAWRSGDEIICNAASFPTTINPLFLYGLIPVFIDCELETYNTTFADVMTAMSPKTAGIMIAHTMGHPYPQEIAIISSSVFKRDIAVIQDSCDCLGASWEDGTKVGTNSALATCSFFPAHHITTGEGGAVFANDPILARTVESICSWGRDCHCDPGQQDSCGRRFDHHFDGMPPYDHMNTYTRLGLNLKMTEIQAVCGLEQLKNVDDFVAKRNYNWQYLLGAMIHAGLEEHLILPVIADGARPSWFGFVMTIREPGQRAELQEYLATYKIGSRLLFGGNITRQPYMRGRNFRISGSLENADKVMEDCLWVGVWPGLTTEMLDFVVQKIKDFFS